MSSLAYRTFCEVFDPLADLMLFGRVMLPGRRSNTVLMTGGRWY
jgi:hypothetical protein